MPTPPRRVSDGRGRGAAGVAAATRRTGRHRRVARAGRRRTPRNPSQVVIGIETDRGLWVEALTAAGYQVYAINPLAVARYRDRHHVSGAKSDAADAKLLADLVRTDRHNHRPIAGDSPDGRGDQGARPGTSESDLGPHPAHQRAALGAARVLPGRAGGVRRPARPRCAGRPGPRSHPRCRPRT